MCILWFHKWGKYGEVKEEMWISRNRYYGTKYTYKRQVQKRTCERCGIIGSKYLN